MSTILWVAKSTWSPAIRRDTLWRSRPSFTDTPHGSSNARRTSERCAARRAPGCERSPAGRRSCSHRPASASCPARSSSQHTDTRLRTRRQRPCSLETSGALVDRVRPDAVVAQTPWQWPAVSGLVGTRRILETTDDSGARCCRITATTPRRSPAPRPQTKRPDHPCRRIDGERIPGGSDGGRSDGVDARLVAPPLRPSPGERRLIYVGTLSPRFDAPLLESALARLPGWGLDLHGQCQYPGCGDQPGSELRHLLEAHPGRVTWHGVTGRDQLAAEIDDADVALVPMRPTYTPVRTR